MDNIILKNICLKNIKLLINNFSLVYNIDKKYIIDSIFKEYNLIIDKNNINIIDIYNYVGIDELSMGNTNYNNKIVDSIFSSSK